MGPIDRSPEGEREKSVKVGWLDADREVVLVGKDLWRPVEALDLVAVLAHVARHLVSRWLLGVHLRRAVDAHHVLSYGVGVEVERDVRVGLDVAHLLAGDGVDQKGLAVPPEPYRHHVRDPVPTGGGKPDDPLALESGCHRLAGHRLSLGLSRSWQRRGVAKTDVTQQTDAALKRYLAPGQSPAARGK